MLLLDSCTTIAAVGTSWLVSRYCSIHSPVLDKTINDFLYLALCIAPSDMKTSNQEVSGSFWDVVVHVLGHSMLSLQHIVVQCDKAMVLKLSRISSPVTHTELSHSLFSNFHLIVHGLTLSTHQSLIFFIFSRCILKYNS